MFNQLVEIGKSGNVFINDHSIALIPKLWEVYKHKRMGSDMVRWIVSVEDYKSPYRRYPEIERIKTVTYYIYEKSSHKLCDDPLVKKAREEYRKLQYDPLIDQYNVINDCMYENNTQLREMKESNRKQFDRLKILMDKEDLSEEDHAKVLQMKDKQSQAIDSVSALVLKMNRMAEERDKLKRMIVKEQESGIQIAGSNEHQLSFLEQENLMETDD